MTKSFRHVLLDADGTLFDFATAERLAFQKSLAEFGVPFQESLIVDYVEINKKMWAAFERKEIEKATLVVDRFKQLFEQYAINLNCSDFNQRYLDRLADESKLYEGALAFCQKVAEKCQVIIATNGVSHVQKKRLKHSGLSAIVSQVIVSEDAGYQKPDEGFFAYSFEKAGIDSKAETVIIGDSLSSDILGGLRYGITTVWYNPNDLPNTSSIQPHYTARSYEQVLQFLFPKEKSDK